MSRRDVMTGTVAGLVGLGAGYATGSRRPAEGTSSAGSTDTPFLVGAPDHEVLGGLVRADLRAFAAGASSDFQTAFARALRAADAVYVPPGVWPVRGPVEVAKGKVLWSDAAFTPSGTLAQGAIVRATRAMAAPIVLTGWGATLSGVTADGAELADAAIEFASDGLFLNDAAAVRGIKYALKATGSFCRIWGGRFSQSQSSGYAMFQQGSDLIMWGSFITRGAIPLWVAGSGCIFGVMHVVGIGGESVPPSIATVRVTGFRNQFVDMYYDTAGGGPNLLVEAGANNNRFIGMTIRNRWAAGLVPAIRCDARQKAVQNNHFDAFITDAGGGTGWTYLLEQLGSRASLVGNILGTGHADGCAALWNVRPSIVGDISTNGHLTRNAGRASLAGGQAQVAVQHGLAGTPRSVSVDLSRGSAPRPDIAVDDKTIRLHWPRPSVALDIYWQAEL